MFESEEKMVFFRYLDVDLSSHPSRPRISPPFIVFACSRKVNFKNYKRKKPYKFLENINKNVNKNKTQKNQ